MPADSPSANVSFTQNLSPPASKQAFTPTRVNVQSFAEKLGGVPATAKLLSTGTAASAGDAAIIGTRADTVRTAAARILRVDMRLLPIRKEAVIFVQNFWISAAEQDSYHKFTKCVTNGMFWYAVRLLPFDARAGMAVSCSPGPGSSAAGGSRTWPQSRSRLSGPG